MGVAKVIFIVILLGLEILVFLLWGWRGSLFFNGAIFIIEYLLRDNLDNFFQEISANVKKIPKLVIERDYEFLDSNKETINWDHDDHLGWRLKKNSELGINISIPGLGLNHQFVYHTDENGCRRTSRESSQCQTQRPVFSVLGCSFTYGHSLNDEDTYAWLLQEKFPDKRVINYAVAGYSLYHSLLVLENNIERDQPEVVVVGFHPDLGWRNTCTFEWAHLIRSTWKIPSCVSEGGKLHRYSPKGYLCLPFSNLKIVKLLELNLNRVIYMSRGKEHMIQKTMEHLLLQIRALCEKHNAKLIVACIDDSKMYYDFLNENGFGWCVTGVDTTELKEDGTFRWILYPFDNHPNREANQKYAEVISGAIEKVLAGKHVAPGQELLQRSFEKEDRGVYVYPLF